MIDYDSFDKFISEQSDWSIAVFQQANLAFCDVHKGQEEELNDQFEDFTEVMNGFLDRHDVKATVLCFLFGRLIDMMIQMHTDDMIDEGIVYDSDEDGAVVIGTYLYTVLYGIAISLKSIEGEVSHD